MKQTPFAPWLKLWPMVIYIAVFIIFLVALVIINNSMVMATMERFGGLDVVFAHAGIEGSAKPLESMTIEEFRTGIPWSWQTCLEYRDAMNAKVSALNINTGARFETYAIDGPRGRGDICLNGAAARLAHPGDLVIILTYAEYEEAELADGHEPTVVHVNSRNAVTELVEDMVPVMWEVE